MLKTFREINRECNFYSNNVDLTEKMLIFPQKSDRVFCDFSTLCDSKLSQFPHSVTHII